MLIGGGRSRDRLPPGPPAPPALQRLAWAQRPIGFAAACRDAYGDTFTVRFGRHLTLVLLCDPAAALEVFAAEPELMRRGDAPSRRWLLGETSVGVTDGDAHAASRAALRPVLAADAVARYRAAISEITLRRLERWPRDQAFALLPDLRELVRDVLVELLIGPRSAAEAARARAALHAVDEARRRARPSIPLVRRVWGPGTPTPRLRAARADLDAVLADLIAARSGDRSGHDLLSGLCAAQVAAGGNPRDGWVRDQAVTLYLTGHDLMWSALGWTFEQLIRQPAVVQDIRRETDTSGSSRLARAAVQEALRLRPPAWLTGARIPREAYAVGGYRVPAGTLLSGFTALIHHDARAFPEPTRFRPDRFLTGDAPPAWIPFGGGPRRCAAEHLALLTATTAFTTAASALHLAPAQQQPERQREVGTVFLPGEGLQVVARDCG
jgi:cytochrome P450